eukprot:Skav224588  [mRNA]  locus=scaffold2684:26935:27369:+ [translate_table: standard]
MPWNLKRNVIQHASAFSSLRLPEGTPANEAKALVAEIHPAGPLGLLGPDARSAAPPSRLQLLRRGSPSVKTYDQSPLQDCLEHCFHALPQGHPPYRAFRSSSSCLGSLSQMLVYQGADAPSPPRHLNLC